MVVGIESRRLYIGRFYAMARHEAARQL